MNRLRLGVLALAAAVVLAWPAVSLAQRRGGDGRRDGGRDGGSARRDGGNWSGRSWDGGRNWGWDGGRSNFFFGYGYPYGLSFGYGRGYYGYGYPYYGYGYGDSPWYGSGYNSYPSYNYGYDYSPGYTTYDQPMYSYGSQGYSYESAYPMESSMGMMGPNQGGQVLATVRVPEANSKLWIEGQQMDSNGLARRFVSPPIDPGYHYSYTMRAQWTENGKTVDQTRTVQVAPGDRITVDFTQPQKATTSEMRGGTRRESGYGPDENGTKRHEERVTPPEPGATPPVERPKTTTPNRDNNNPPANPDKNRPNPDKPE